MNVSRRWLEDLLLRPLDARDVSERLAMLGAAVDDVVPLAPGLDDIVVGLVEEVRPHPNADRLRLCVVNDGKAERRRVVCGAPNVSAGKKYPFAPLGAVLPGALTIEKRKIRGETSEGMLCSARELGLGEEHEGILELETEAPPGTPLLQALPIADDRLVLDVTPNRPDLLGHKGVARELAHSYGVVARLPAIPGASGQILPVPRRTEEARTVTGGVTVGIEDDDGCPRFSGAVISGVRVTGSPAWLRRRLEAVGMRSINNVVDAANYVMFELNQPMHAYDIATLKGPSLIARRARLGEALVTLDQTQRFLTDEMTVIADAAGAIGIAGVMGAAHVEVTEHTTEVFLECAYFEPKRIRRTRKALGISSEASYRFERGVDRWGVPEALRRCIEIILAAGGGALADQPVDLWPEPTQPPRIFLRPSRVARVLGLDLPSHQLEQHLIAVGCTVLPKPDDGRLAVDAPGWRPDLVREIDLIEEIARIHGYGEFPDDLRPFRIGQPSQDALAEVEAEVRRGLCARGLFEALTLPMGPAEGPESVRLLNPLSAEEAYLRERLLPGLLRRVQYNWSRGVRDVRLFEIGTVFRRSTPGDRPVEERRVSGVVTGCRQPAHWTDGGKAGDVDWWDLKAAFEATVALAIPGARLQVDRASWLAVAPGGTPLGWAGRLEAQVPAWAAPVFGFEVSVDPAPRLPARFVALPATPAVERDLALVLPAGLSAREVGAAVRRVGGEFLESIEVFDEYRSAAMAAGQRGIAFRLVFRAPDRTLRDAEVDQATARVVEVLEKELDIQLRTS